MTPPDRPRKYFSIRYTNSLRRPSYLVMVMDETVEHAETRARFEATWKKGKRGFLAHASRNTRNQAEAEDVVGDVVLRALSNIGALANVQNISAWIYAAIKNRVIDLWRQDKTRKAAGESDVAEELIGEIVAGTGFDPQDQFVRDELNDALAEAIAALPPEQRQVIEAQVFDGISFRELSEQTGIPIDTLAGRKRYAIKALQAILRDWIED